MNICLDCHVQFDGGPRTLRCPPCRAEQTAMRKRAFMDARPGYCNARLKARNSLNAVEREHHAATHYRNTSTAWVLVEAPPGCDFRPGAQFSSTELQREYCHDWVQAGMVFESAKGIRRF